MAKQDIVLASQESRLVGGQLMLVVRTLLSPSTSCRRPPFSSSLQFFGLQLALFLSFLDSTSVSTAAPTIGAELNASSSITWVGSSFLLANTAFQIVTSRLSDIFGRKAVLLGSLFLFVLGDLLCGFAQSGVWLYACRGIAGIGGGGINSLSMIIVSSIDSFLLSSTPSENSPLPRSATSLRYETAESTKGTLICRSLLSSS